MINQTGNAYEETGPEHAELVGAQRLLDDLHREHIQMHGVDVHYMPRAMMSPDGLFGETGQSAFPRQFPIEMYFQSSQGFTGDQEFVAAMGVVLQSQLMLSVARSRFREEAQAADVSWTELTTPREGDLIWHPMLRRVLIITHVDGETPFYQLGNKYLWVLKVEQWKNEHSIFDVGIPEIDALSCKTKQTTPGDAFGTDDGVPNTDVSLDRNQDNVQVEIEADGSSEDMWADRTKIIPTGPGTAKASRGSGIVDFGRQNQQDIEQQFNKY